MAITLLLECERNTHHDTQTELEQAIRRADTKAAHHALTAY